MSSYGMKRSEIDETDMAKRNHILQLMKKCVAESKYGLEYMTNLE